MKSGLETSFAKSGLETSWYCCKVWVRDFGRILFVANTAYLYVRLCSCTNFIL